MANNYPNGARKNQVPGKQNPFADEFGVQKEGDSDQIQDSYHDTGSGWMPGPWTAKIKKPIRLSLWDNSEVQGNDFPYHNRQDSAGSGFGSEGNPQTRNYDRKDSDAQENWEHEPGIVRDFPSPTNPMRPNPNTENGIDYIDDEELQFAAKQKGEIRRSTMEIKKLDFKKIAAEKQARQNRVYEIEEDYTVYGRYCNEPTCVGVWKELLGFDQKRAMKIERDSEVWRCPKCGRVTEAIGSISEQTSGPAAYNTNSSNAPIAEEDGFDAVNSIKPDKERKLR